MLPYLRAFPPFCQELLDLECLECMFKLYMKSTLLIQFWRSPSSFRGAVFKVTV